MKNIRKKITKIIYTNSTDNSEGLVIRFENINNTLNLLCDAFNSNQEQNLSWFEKLPLYVRYLIYLLTGFFGGCILF